MTVRIADELVEGRYHRQTLIEWWDQERVQQAHFLVVGAGALGNEVLKNLALMGARRVVVYDMDRIEQSNLSRAVLFRETDEGAFKAEVAVQRMRYLNPAATACARAENIIFKAGLGVFLWADVVVCGVDNREARIFVNSACARTGRPWVDGAIEGFDGVVRAFHPKDGACYECTMNETDRQLVAERRSCAMLARDVVALGRVPATAVASSVVGALQVQEALKILHGQPALIGEGLHLSGLWDETSRVKYPRRKECPGHEFLGPVTPLDAGVAGITLGELVDRAEAELGEGAVLEFSRDVVVALSCPECGHREPGRAVVGEITEKQARCPQCRTHRIVEIATSAGRDGPVNLALTPADMGIPPFDIMVARQGLHAQRAWLFDADASAVLGPLVESERSGPNERT
ncbi:MAG: HesA/MoeB/ThiF family protein [Planctomycetota bacterium]